MLFVCAQQSLHRSSSECFVAVGVTEFSLRLLALATIGGGRHIGELMGTLDAYNLTSDTLVFFASDNGARVSGGLVS